jgi:hypothetical protein
MKEGRTLRDLATELQRQVSTKKDLIADTRQLRLVATDSVALATIGENGKIDEQFGVTRHAHRQIGDRLGIPGKYMDRMREEAPQLMADNVNHWFQEAPERRLVRTLDGDVRAFLSDRYHRIDNFDVAETVLPVLSEIPDLRVVSCEVTESRMYLKAVTPRIAGEVTKGDEVQAGVMITNSEIGRGSLSVTPLVYRLVCLNGMILPDSRYRKYHVGARADESEALYELLSDETREADDRAIMLKVRDVVRGAMDEAVFKKTVGRLRLAKANRITGNPAAAIEVLTTAVGLNQEEQGGVLRHLIEGADLSRYGVLNAVTRASQDVESYDRATELETVGGRVLELGPEEWREIAEAA